MIFKRSSRAVIPNRSAPPLPPLRVQALNYARATFVAAGKMIRGEPIFNSLEEAQRLVEQYCKECPKYRWIDGKCSACGCPMLDRAQRADLGCPLRKF